MSIPTVSRGLFAASLLALACGCAGAMRALDSEKEMDEQAQIEYYESAAMTYYEGGRWIESSRMWLKVLEIEPNRKKAKWGLARAYNGQQTPQSLRQAEALLAEIVNYDWTHPEYGDRKHEVQKDLATVYTDLADYYQRDILALEYRLSHDPNIDQAAAENQIAKQRRERDVLLRKAIPLYRRVLANSKDNAYALAGLAKVYLTLGEEEQGIDFAERFLRLSQQSQVRWRQRMAAWEKQAGRDVTSDQRSFFLEKIHGARAKEKKMYLLLGSVHMRRNEFGSAVKSYTKVIDLDPAVPAAYVERAQAYAALRQYSLAVKDLEHYLKVTDPQTHRDQRVSAAELLDRYQRVLNRAPLISSAG